MTGDIEFLYNRSKGRDLDSSRHLGHLVSCYHKGDILEDRSKADCIVTKEIYYPQILKELTAMLE
ncbi:MAG: hypothetical protein ACOX1S_12680 [Anaerostipes sp.]|nr:hypothetical protein [Anaerostipes sp.]